MRQMLTKMDSELGSARKAQEFLRGKLFGRERPPRGKRTNGGTTAGRKEAFSTLKLLMERTILHGEGNSLLVIGPRGSGKSWVLEEVFQSLDTDPKCKNNYIKIMLNGLVHKDDRLALLEIARRLDVKEDLGDRISISFSAALNYLLEALQSGSRANQSVVIVLDEFDLFAHHKNQTLLYNLFDSCVAQATPIAVIGLTCRLDAVELLEKRVKSRFSHRQLLLFPDSDFENYMDLFKTLLNLPDDFPDQKYGQRWRENIEELSRDTTVRRVLRERYNNFPDIRSLKTLLTLPVCRLGIHKPFLQPSDFAQASAFVGKDCTSVMLRGISVLELCLVIAMRKLTEVSGGESFNFEMVYQEYKKFAERTSSVELFSKPVALKAFEHLTSLEFVSPADLGGGKIQKEYQSMLLQLDEREIDRAVMEYPHCPTDVTRWGSSRALV